MDQTPGRARRAAAAIAAVAGSVLVVILVTTLPHAVMVQAQGSGPSRPRTEPTPMPVLDDPGDRSWQALRCRGGQRDCAVPQALNHAGLRLWQYAVGSSAILAVDDRTRALSAEVPAIHGNRWVLVGAEHSGPGSSLSITIGTSITATIPAGRLSLFPVSGRSPKTVSVTERGTPGHDEVLYIAAYRFTS